MIRPAINMVIAGQYKFDFVASIEIESSWDMLTDTCDVELPAKLKLNALKLREIIKPGDEITIDLGYGDQTTRVFTGYIVGIKPKTPIVLTCEDQMHALKLSSITDTMKHTSLKKIVGKHFKKFDVDCDDLEIGTIQFDKLSQAQILEKLREKYAIYSFFRGSKLIIEKAHSASLARIHFFRFQHNIIDDNLEYRRKEDMKIKVTAVSNNPNGKQTEVKVGENEGEERTLNFYNVSKDALKKAALRELERLKYDGFHGDFSTFGSPVVFHGDIVTLEHPEESDKTGSYYVDKVIYNFGMDGFRQHITLGSKS